MTNALMDASDAQVAALDSIVSSLRQIDATLSSVLAVRDGMLALASRLALTVAEQGGHPDHGDLTLRTVAAEIGAAQRVSDRTVQRWMADAEWLVTRFPQVWAAQGAGRISAGHARVIVEAGSHLEDPAERAAYAESVLAIAEQESPNRLRPMARRLAERYQPLPIDERHRRARKKCGVWLDDLEDGNSKITAITSSALAHGMFDRLSEMATELKNHNAQAAAEARAAGARVVPASDAAARQAAGSSAFGSAADGAVFVADDRTVAQLRADLLADLVLSGVPTGHDTEDGLLARIVPHVQVTVPILTLMGLDRAGVPLPPAELDGACPIDLDTARRLAGAASGWDRVLTDPITGGVLAVDRYRPSTHLRRYLHARDQRCRFPTCGRRASQCDLDHNRAASAGGATSAENLGDFCRRHHILKHHSPWHVEQLGGGVFAWTSPTGRLYIDRPPPQNTVTFQPPDPDPSRDLWASVPAAETAPF
ncbi:13E12 repeat family protein [Microbacterium neungamense]|uniref:13E12 repeat family protein n=1 Tax=Microbacterium neungamense TaxID=2810535 RepID=UPI00217ECAB8|nr:13E12 repeat family protein [Microbacterium neungamense]UWF77433.1 DUF222 domain-containing protein [Microbacterium neungamense]